MIILNQLIKAANDCSQSVKESFHAALIEYFHFHMRDAPEDKTARVSKSGPQIVDFTGKGGFRHKTVKSNDDIRVNFKGVRVGKKELIVMLKPADNGSGWKVSENSKWHFEVGYASDKYNFFEGDLMEHLDALFMTLMARSEFDRIDSNTDDLIPHIMAFTNNWSRERDKLLKRHPITNIKKPQPEPEEDEWAGYGEEHIGDFA